MRARARVPWLVALACALWLLPAAASASHTVFSSAVDRFEADGNPFGSADGAFDYADEFDDGTLAPDWVPLLGTAIEAGGVVTLRNPGTDFSGLDVSNIENEDPVVNGAGNFTASTYWVPTVPSADREFHFQLYGVGGLIESAGLSFTNISPGAASPPAIAGPAITQQLTHIDGSGFHTDAFATVPVEPAMITGRIVLRLSFDDASDQLIGSFSLDGGVTFQSPFPSIPIFAGVSDAEFLIGAGSAGDSGPPPPPSSQRIGTKQLVVKNPSVPSARRVVYQVKETGGHPVVGIPSTGGATLHVLLDGVTQCFAMPPSRWSGAGSTFRYADPFGASGPVAAAEIKDHGRGRLGIKVVVMGRLGAVDLVPPNPGTQADTNFTIGGGGEYCGSTAAGAIKPNTAKTFKAKNAPAPAVCNLGPC